VTPKLKITHSDEVGFHLATARQDQEAAGAMEWIGDASAGVPSDRRRLGIGCAEGSGRPVVRHANHPTGEASVGRRLARHG